MSIQIQFRRGTTAEHSTFTGAVGEITVDTTKDTAVVHDNSQVGGFALLREDGSNCALSDGSASTPAIKFSSSTTTGIYSPGANQFGIATNGVGRITIDASGNVVAGGTLTAGSFIPTSSTVPTNGLYSPGTNQLALSTNGTGRLFVDADGRVLVGTSTSLDTGGLFQVNSDTSGIIHYYEGGNTTPVRLRLTKSRGATTAAITGDGLGEITFRGRDTSNNLRSAAAITGEVDATPGASSVPGRLVFSTTADGSSSPTERLRITSAGLVGIGTSSPIAPLHVNGAIRSTYVGDGSDFIGWGSSSLSNKYAYIAATNEGSQDIGLSFNVTTNAGSSNIEAIRIDDLGNVGIGTTSPSAKLDIATGALGGGLLVGGDVNTDTGARTDATRKYFVMGAYSYTNANRKSTILVADNDGTDNNVFLGGGQAALNAATTLRFYTAANNNTATGTERARIDSSGRLLVGTSSAFSAGSAAQYGRFQMVGNTVSAANNAILALGRGEGAATIINNETLGTITFSDNVGNTFAQIDGAADGTAGSNDYPGRLVFSVTADGASSPTERMRITNGGYLKASNTGTYESSAGAFHELRTNSASDLAALIYANNSSYTGAALQIGGSRNTTDSSWQFLKCRHNSIDRLLIQDSGNVQNVNNSYGAISDIKLKENIVDASSQWSDIKALQVRNYNFKEGQTHTQIGLVAQEVELVSPGLVSESPDRDEEGNDLGTVTKSVNYSVLYMKAVKALQEAMERIEQLEAKVAALESA